MPADLQRILYVEDEPDIRVVAQMALEAVGGFTVIASASGSDTLAAAPGAGADVIPKPFDPMALAAQIREIFERPRGEPLTVPALPSQPR